MGTVVEVTVNVAVVPVLDALVAVASRVPPTPARNSTVPAPGAAEPLAAVTVAVKVTGAPKVAVNGVIEVIVVVVLTVLAAATGTKSTPLMMVPAGAVYSVT